MHKSSYLNKPVVQFLRMLDMRYPLQEHALNDGYVI